MDAVSRRGALHNPYRVEPYPFLVTQGSGSRRNPGLYYATPLALNGNGDPHLTVPVIWRYTFNIPARLSVL